MTTPNTGAAELPEALRKQFELWLPKCWSRATVTDSEGEKQYADEWVQGAFIGYRAALTGVQIAKVEALSAAQAGVPADLITIRKPTTSAEMLWLLKLAHLVISDVDKTLEETFAPAQPAAQQGVAYAELPYQWREKVAELADQLEKCGVAWIRTNGGTTYNVGRNDGAKFAASELRKVLADETEHVALRASHGQALRLLTQKEKDSLGRRAEGMDGNEWDQWVQEKFAQVNGLKVQGGSYEWDWE